MITIKIKIPKDFQDQIRKAFEGKYNEQARKGGYSGVKVKIDRHGNMSLDGPEETAKRYLNECHGASYDLGPIKSPIIKAQKIDTNAGRIDTNAGRINTNSSLTKPSKLSPQKKKL